MERLEVTGGYPLTGSVKISGAKNEALKVIALAVLVKNKFTATSVPDIADIRSQLKIFDFLGGESEFSDGELTLDGSDIDKNNLDNDIAKKLRASIVFLGPLLARFSSVTLPFPGGCAIGRRPIDTHLKAFQELGAKIKKTDDSYEISFDRFSSNEVNFSEPSVTATENILMFLAAFDEDFTINNCAVEPEIQALIDILNKAGAKISQTADRSFSVRGNSNLKLDKVAMIPDRIEAFSYLIGFLVTGGSGMIEDFPADQMQIPLEKLRSIGAEFKIEGNKAIVENSSHFRPFSIATAPYPDFPTDMQSPMSLIAILADGTSKINETMFENRLGYIKELKKMGLEAKLLNKHEAEITGPCHLKGAKIDALDLRSGITLVLAALAASGKSVILDGQIIDRGYEKLTEKLKGLGAQIERYD